MSEAAPTPARTFGLTAITMVAFASNSLLCRLALAPGLIDAASFTSIRIASGALTLWLIVRLARRSPAAPGGGWMSPVFLFLYANAFSYAYLTLPAGLGALILFGCVQATMIVAALHAGERPRALEWTGLAIALAGLAVLTRPGLTAPPPAGSALMALAGIAWGVYSLRGRGSRNALVATGRNFMRAVPFALVAAIVFFSRRHAHPHGVMLAVASGALASGVGYAIWYAALRGLTATRAATVQLSVPVIAAIGGVLLLNEGVTVRLLVSAAMILGGIGIALAARSSPSR
jgi:drug/metabolite transporter (DMT)-like permease